MDPYHQYQSYYYQFRSNPVLQQQHRPLTFEEWLYYNNINNGSQSQQSSQFQNTSTNSNTGQQTSRQNKRKGPAPDLSVSKLAKSSHSESQRTTWTDLEEEVLVAHWKENFHVLETLWRDEAWAKIVSAVETVGNKTIKQCKSKIDKLKEKYKEAKDLNGETGAAGANINKSPFFDVFDEMLRDENATC